MMQIPRFLMLIFFITFLSGLVVPATTDAQEKTSTSIPPLDSVLLRYSREIAPNLKKDLDKRRLELLDMGWGEFWEREEAVWKRISQLMQDSEAIKQRLIPLERKKSQLIGAIRQLRRKERSLSEQMRFLVQLRRLSSSILPLADKLANMSREIKSLYDEWLLFQSLGQALVSRMSNQGLIKFVSSVVDSYVGAFRKGKVEEMERLLFRGVKVNGRFDQRSYMRHLREYYNRFQVTAFEVDERRFLEINPFTLRVEARYKISEASKRRQGLVRTRQGEISFTLREVGNIWLISKMNVPD